MIRPGHCWAICLSLFLSACASAPQIADKSVSQFNGRAQTESPLVALATSQPNSGIRLLADPSEALQSRLHMAALATTTLDIQYYLWQGDNSGLALTHEVLQAADPGVRVRVLLDDIYHSGRDSAYQTLDAHPNVEVRLFDPMGNRGAAKQVNHAFKKSTFNYRMHNKIFLVDAFCMGRDADLPSWKRALSVTNPQLSARAPGASPRTPPRLSGCRRKCSTVLVRHRLAATTLNRWNPAWSH